MSKLPVVEICGREISRLIIGGNTISGTSHMSAQLDGEMEDFFTTARVKEMLFHCEECGINAMQLRGDKHIMRIIREYRAEGGKMNWVAQTTPEISSFERNVNQIAAYKPALIYQHGVQADTLFKAGKLDELQAHLRSIRASGYPVGLGTHMPNVIEYADSHKWDIDFYMACLFNISDPERMAMSERLGSEDPLYVEGDAPIMYDAVRSTKKPVLLFKIMAGMRRCKNQQTVQKAFDDAFEGVKPSDCVVVGMYPKAIDQVALNASYALEAINKAQSR